MNLFSGHYSHNAIHRNKLYPAAFRRKSDSGMILATVLIFLGFLAGLVIQAQVSARQALSYEERKLLRAQLNAAATDAAWCALRVLAGDTTLQTDHTNEPWAFVVTRSLPHGIETTTQIQDENRRFDVNNLSARPADGSTRTPVDMVKDLLAARDQPDPEEQALNLQDWIDADQEPSRQPDPANALMESPAELAWALARDSTAAPYLPELTVLPDRQARIVPININTAGRSVLGGVFGPRHAVLAETICRIRDARPLTSMAELDHLADPKVMRGMRAFLDVKSSYFSVSARASKDDYAEELYGLVRRDDRGGIEIIRWVCR